SSSPLHLFAPLPCAHAVSYAQVCPHRRAGHPRRRPRIDDEATALDRSPGRPQSSPGAGAVALVARHRQDKSGSKPRPHPKGGAKGGGKRPHPEAAKLMGGAPTAGQVARGPGTAPMVGGTVGAPAAGRLVQEGRNAGLDKNPTQHTIYVMRTLPLAPRRGSVPTLHRGLWHGER